MKLLLSASIAGLILLAACQAPAEMPATAVPEAAAESPTEVATTEPSIPPTETPAPPPTALPPTPEPVPTQPADSGLADADVLFVKAVETSPGIWTFSVTVAHPDTGWEDYADGWDVVLPDGTAVLPNPDSPFTRLLLHPHEAEQPFTRSQSNIELNADLVSVRAHDLVDGFGGREITVDLSQSVVTDEYEVERAANGG